MIDYFGESDDEEEKPPVEMPAVKAPVEMPQAQPDRLTVIKDYLQKAREKADTTNNVANFGDALSTIFSANAVGRGGPASDSSYWNNLKSQAQNQVEQAENNVQKTENFLTKQEEVKRQVAKDMIDRGTEEQRQLALKFTNAKFDPTSDQSKNAQKAFLTTFANRSKLTPEQVANMSAEDLAQAGKDIESIARVDDVKLNNKMKSAALEDRAVTKNQAAEYKEGLRQQNAFKKDIDTLNTTSRSNLGLAVNKVNSADRLLAFADVTSAELQKAYKDKNAEAKLLKKLDHHTPQQYTEIISGLMSQISNGQGSLGQLEHLLANTASGTKANIMQYVKSEPVPAKLGKLIFSALYTLENEKKVSQAVVDRFKNNLKVKHYKAFEHPDLKDSTQAIWEAYTKTDVPEWRADPAVPSLTNEKPLTEKEKRKALKWANRPENKDNPKAQEIRDGAGVSNEKASSNE